MTTRLDHVAHAAPRIRDLLPLYRDVLGGVFHAGGDNTRVGYRAVVLRFADGGRVELIEPIGDSGFLDSFLARNPLGGLHHVTYYVDALDRVVADARAHGLTVVGEWSGEGYAEAFVHPRSGHGALTQFVEAAPGHRLMGLGSDLETVLRGR